GLNYLPVDPPNNAGTITITDATPVNLPPNGWRLTAIASAGSTTEGLGINNLGQAVGVVGFYYVSTAGFLWGGGSVNYLPPWYWMYPDQNFAGSRAINNGGLAVGRWAGGTPDTPSSSTPCFWNPDDYDGSYISLTTLPSAGGTPTTQDTAEDINNGGTIV